MLKVYYLFTFLINYLVPLVLKFRLLKKKEDPDRYKEKLGKYIKNTPDEYIWFHASSLGELKSIEKLIKPLMSNFSGNYKALITTSTKSSGDYAKSISNDQIIHQYAPIDTPQIIMRFLNHWNPTIGIFIEAEIWPNLIIECENKNIPLILLNARFSPSSLRKWGLIQNVFVTIMRNFKIITTMSKTIKEKLTLMGLNNAEFIGNLKFYNSANQIESKKNANNFVGMSIHPGELKFLISAHQKILQTQKNFTSIIIPRHINKIYKFEQLLTNLNCTYTKYSENNKITSGIILVDKYNIAEKFFNYSNVVFMGGSFIKHGGQNPLEPARKNCKVLHGPSIYNFDEIYEFLKKNNVSSLVKNEDDLAKQIELNLNNASVKNFNNIIDSYGLEIFNNTLNKVKNFINDEIK